MFKSPVVALAALALAAPCVAAHTATPVALCLDQWNTLRGSCEARDGALQATTEKESILLAKAPLPDHFALTATLTLKSHLDIGLLFRAQDAGRYFLVQVSKEHQALRVWECTGKSPNECAVFTWSIKLHEPHTLRVVGRGARYEVWVDGKFLHKFENAELTGGHAGCRAVGLGSIRDVTIGPAPPERKLKSEDYHAAAIRPLPPVCGRPVRIASICVHGKPVAETARLVEAEAAKGTDLVILPECWTGKRSVPLDDPAVTSMAAVARKHKTYVVCAVYRKDGDKAYNSAILLDRQGKVAGIYDKVYPVLPEFEKGRNLQPGQDAPVFETDFGKLGFAICFDANFGEVWQRLADLGAELVVFTSAFSGGRILGAHATLHGYYVVSCTWRRECQVYDITGEKLLDERKGISRVTLDLDRRRYHIDCNVPPKNKLLKEHPDDVQVEKWQQREAWFILRPSRPGVDLRALARQYGLEEYRDYIRRSRRDNDRRRGAPFQRIGPTPDN